MVALFGLVLASCTAGAQSIEAGPYLQSATPEDIWVVWETSSGTESVVEWGITSTLGEETQGSATTGKGSSRIHEVQLTGLTADTRYFYRVHTGDTASEINEFRTPPEPEAEQSFRLLAMSDMQIDYTNANKFNEIVNVGVIPFLDRETDQDLSDSLALTLIPGDLVENGWTYSQWAEDFFAPAADLMAQVPTYPVMGNHEGDTPYFLQYFHLPEDGTEGYEEHWYTTDYSNLRVIGLDSNSDYRIDAQLDWLDVVLYETCFDDQIDFVFAQLHHPHMSELWIDGEIDFTGDVIERLEDFSTDCGKPSLHFFGHTHGYSRGQSMEHEHLWVNVATAGGNIDYWGEYAQADYSQFTVSQDEWGFVLVDVEAGDRPNFRLRRISQGNEIEARDNEVRDEITIYLHNEAPDLPEAIFPLDEEVNPDCLVLEGSEFLDTDGDAHGASHWQVSPSCDDFSDPSIDRWIQHENWYFDEDTQAGDNLENESLQLLDPVSDYCWRVRYRDQGLAWSDWSDPAPFSTGTSTLTENLLINGDAESGTDGWTVTEGYLEALGDGECEGVAPYEGEAYFAVGGLCDSAAYAEAYQEIDLSDHTDAIETGQSTLLFSGFFSNWSGQDIPEAWLELLDEDGEAIASSDILSQASPSWTEDDLSMDVDPDTRSVRIFMSGTRSSGTDNDAYIDDLSLRLNTGEDEDTDCEEEEEEEEEEDGNPQDGANDTGEDSTPARTAECGCASHKVSHSSGWFLGLFCLEMGLRRRRL